VHTFLRITPANYLYALLLSLRHPVGVWKLEVPEWLGRRFVRLRPYRLFTRDEWLRETDRCFDAWKTAVLPALLETQRCEARYRGRAIDLSTHLLQGLGSEFESLFLFIATVLRHHAAARPPLVIVAPWFVRWCELSRWTSHETPQSTDRPNISLELLGFRGWPSKLAHAAYT